ncbi:LytTR family DNA-binding domain-containing protein [Alloscardovia venturai]|uniref:LytTR family DNA-binding domain-containing protein n=1 Tax=Alloscardovia venturai TaxID=1769421 RepID=A0ABW2Y6E3_9BIFI
MKVSFQQSNAAIEPIALIIAQERTQEVETALHILKELSTDSSHLLHIPLDMISGTYHSHGSVLPVSSITYFYASHKKIFARHNRQDWQVNLTLKMLDTKLDSQQFVRVSNSAIINMHALVRFDANLAGSYAARLRDGSQVKVSSRYVNVIKSRLISHL